MVFEQVKKIIVDTLNCDEEEITLETSLADDLGADSLDAVELVMALEDEFDMKVEEEDYNKLTTVKAIVDYIESK